MNSVTVPIVILPHAENLELPHYATNHSAGMDLLAALTEDRVIQTGERALIPTGLAMALPPGYEAQIRPRSGLALKQGLTVLNSPGTIDADYRGEIQVLLINLGHQAVTIIRGMRIAQMIVAPYARVAWNEVATLRETERGTGGFGSTGIMSKKPAS